MWLQVQHLRGRWHLGSITLRVGILQQQNIQRLKGNINRSWSPNTSNRQSIHQNLTTPQIWPNKLPSMVEVCKILSITIARLHWVLPKYFHPNKIEVWSFISRLWTSSAKLKQLILKLFLRWLHRRQKQTNKTLRIYTCRTSHQRQNKRPLLIKWISRLRARN